MNSNARLKLQLQQEQAVLRAFTDSVQRVKNQVMINEIVRALDNGNVDAVIDLLQLDAATFEPLTQSIISSYQAGGIAAAQQIGRIPKGDGTIAVRFNARSIGAETWAKTLSSERIVEIASETKDVIRAQITEGLAAGMNPKSVALDIIGRVDGNGVRRGGVIGLTKNQAEWVNNAREELINLDKNYLTRGLRDNRFDSIVEKAIDDGVSLSDEKVSKIINSMQNRTLKYRGDTIAKTESINALRAGQNEAVLQAIEIGELDARDAFKAWDSTGDGKVREWHKEAEDQGEIPFDEPFIVDGEELMYPGDPAGSPENIINCRCRLKTVIDFGGKVARLEGYG